jgi:COX assembly mitochondrial protein 1
MAMAPSMPQVPSGTPQVNVRNPLPLSAAQEAEVRKVYYARVRAKCSDELKGISPGPSSSSIND